MEQEGLLCDKPEEPGGVILRAELHTSFVTRFSGQWPRGEEHSELANEKLAGECLAVVLQNVWLNYSNTKK